MGNRQVTVRVDVGAWQIGIGQDVHAFRLGPSAEASTVTLNAFSAKGLRQVSAVVEIVYQISGTRPHALLAGEYWPGNDEILKLEVARGGAFDLSGPETKGPLELPVVVGLPSNLAAAAANGVSSVRDALPSGRVRIHGGAIDVHSSPMVFQRCGAALWVVLIAKAMNESPTTLLSKLVATW
jgi:hypothetical protein